MGKSDTNKRLTDILVTLNRFAQGEYSERLPVSGRGDEIDAITEALNDLAEVLDRRGQDFQKKQQKIESLLDILLRYTLLDFSQKASVHDDGDEIDAMAAGLNALAEEVIDHMNKLKQSQQKIMHLNGTLEQRVLERTEELRTSEEKYRHLFENNPMPLWVVDAETSRLVDVNDSALKHYGYTREEFLSMTALDLRPEDEKKRYLDLKRGMRGTRNTGIWKHCKKDGTIIFAEVIAHEMVFEGKIATLVLSHDVTEERKARQALEFSEARFRRVFDSKMTGFFFWDEDGTITDANDLFLDMVGYSRSDVHQRRMNLNDLTPVAFADLQLQALAQIRALGVCEPFEKEYIRKGGERFPVLIGAANINDGALIKGVTCVMDISQRKKMEQEILELNRDLELRISERTRELKEANQELESFSYSVSHDLRAPLRAIHGYSQMLYEDYESRLDQEGIRQLNAVKQNARRMGQLVDDLLAFSRLGKRSVSETEIDLTVLVHDVLKEISEEDKRRAKISVHPLGTAVADVTLLRQAIQNLLSNALKYSAKKEHPEVEIGATVDNGVATYFVRDNGAGFDMAYYEKLFGVFQRLHGQDEFDGTGVGLAIVQRIIHRHGGKVWAEGRVGEGATFYFTLPGRDHATLRNNGSDQGTYRSSI